MVFEAHMALRVNRARKVALLVGSLLVGGLAFWGHQKSVQSAFVKGEQLGKERAVWLGFATPYRIAKMLEKGDAERAKRVAEDGMWRAIVEMDKLASNPDATERERRGVSQTSLPMLVLYFYEHPREIRPPEKSDISGAVDRGIKQENESGTSDDATKSVVKAVGESAKGALSRLDASVDGLLGEMYRMDFETQAVLDRQIAQRNFPGRESSGGGVTFLMPPDTGGGGGTDSSFDFHGKKIRVDYRDGVLKVNDLNYGPIVKGDQVDLRILGRVFVNDTERQPVRGSE